MSGMLSAGKGAIIRVAVDESKLPAGAHLFWDNIYSDGMLYCEQTMAINQLSVDFQCPYDGVVTLSLSVFREGSEIPEVESLMVVVGLPGSITVPNPGDDSAIDPPAVDPISMTPGQVLYLNNCRDCHGDLAVSRKRGSTRARLDTAINSVAAMRTLATLTSQERDLIIQALGQ